MMRSYTAKGAMLAKMPGDTWQQFANLRLLYSLMFVHPGKKLLFMGAEFGQWREWNDHESLDWHLCQYPPHQGLQTLLRELNRLLREQSALHQVDFSWQGFQWIDFHDSQQECGQFPASRQSGGRLSLLCV